MCRKLIFLIFVVLLVGLVSTVRSATVFHWSFDGPRGQDLVSDTDGVGGAVAKTFYDAGVADPNVSLTYGEPNPHFNIGGTSADFHNYPDVGDPGIGLMVIDPGKDSDLDLSTLGACTLEAFVYPYVARQAVILRKYIPGYYYIDTRETGSFAIRMAGGGQDLGDGGGVCNDLTFDPNTWYHVALVWDGSVMKFYVDGIQSQSLGPNSVPELPFTGPIEDSERGLGIGCIVRDNEGPPPSSSGQFFHGRIDELRISDEALPPSRFLLYETGGAASHPSPKNRTENICDGATLCWTPGDYAQDVDAHDIYLGTDFNDVNDADTTSSVYVQSQNRDANCYATSGLELGTTYYWRIDEVNDANTDSPWKGSVWQFTTNDGSVYNPYPADEQTVIPLDATLNWTPGCLAESHDVYFGTDFNDVNEADTTTSGVYKGNQAFEANEYDPCDFEYFTWYYWRVDEVGASQTWRGEVWGFRSQSAIIDVNFVAWYELDETEGETAHDSSGYENHARVDGPDEGVNWDGNDGHYGGSLVFDDDTDVKCPTRVLSNIRGGITISVWLKDAYRSGANNWVFEAAGTTGSIVRAAVVEADTEEVLWRAGNDSNDVVRWDLDKADPERLQGWHHWAFVKDETSGEISIYFDGFVEESNDVVDNTLVNVRDKQLRFGVAEGHSNDFIGKMDDIRVYDYGLSAGEIAELFRGGDLSLAWAPSPSDFAIDVPRDVNLAWRPGDYAVQHDVYFGTDWDDVNDADSSLPVGTSVYKGRQDPCEYDPPGILELDTTYYWRIDEVNEADVNSPWKGNIWRFTVANFLIIDDMETYNQTDNWISDTWLDGFENSSGAEVYVGIEPLNPAHGGEQSMIYLYYNDGGIWNDLDYYSEIEIDTSMLAIGSDWTEAGVKTLTLFFDGNSTNDANEQMYAVLEDTGGTYAQVDYGYYADEDMNDIKKEEWYEWDIALSDFSGVDANNVKKLYIGFGIRGNPNPGGTPGGSGIVYFDDARLYLRKCVPWRLKPACDFTSDCKVDIADVGRMAESWLKSDKFVDVVEEPNTPVVYYEFNETSGGTAEDSSNNYDGVAKVDDVNTTDAFWESDGRFGGCIRFDRKEKIYCVEMPNDVFTNHITNQITISVWVNWEYPDTMPGETNQLFSMHGGAGDVYKGILGIETAWAEEKLRFWDVSKGAEYKPREDDWSGGWNHYAFVKHITDVNDGYLRIYLNSDLVAKSDSNAPMSLPADNAWIGMATDQPKDWHDEYTGLLDEFRVYDYALSEAEIGWLASAGTGYIPLVAMVNIYDEEDAGEKAVNFRDVAKLMHSWGEEKLWPPE